MHPKETETPRRFLLLATQPASCYVLRLGRRLLTVDLLRAARGCRVREALGAVLWVWTAADGQRLGLRRGVAMEGGT